jgi:hypothetical protein
MEQNSVWGLFPIAALVLSLASGCTSDQYYEYKAHTDKVTEGAGNASAANRAIHTIDPWPAHSEKTQIDMDGKRALTAVRRYETNNGGRSKDLSADASANGNGGTRN